jgi:hypothetical protein
MLEYKKNNKIIVLNCVYIRCMHTLLNQIAELILCDFSFVFSLGCAIFACRIYRSVCARNSIEIISSIFCILF